MTIAQCRASEDGQMADPCVVYRDDSKDLPRVR